MTDVQILRADLAVVYCRHTLMIGTSGWNFHMFFMILTLTGSITIIKCKKWQTFLFFFFFKFWSHTDQHTEYTILLKG